MINGQLIGYLPKVQLKGTTKLEVRLVKVQTGYGGIIFLEIEKKDQKSNLSEFFDLELQQIIIGQ